MRDNVIIITGPTAVGKSEIAVEIAKKIDGEIISADSMQIYKGLNIGSGKITQSEMAGVKHYLLDFLQINQSYSVAEFCEDCKIAIKKIIDNKKIPIIVGGTGLYIKALVNDYNYHSVQKNEKLRTDLENYAQIYGNEKLYEKLKELSPTVAEKISINDKKRIIRAIEVLSGNKVDKERISDEFNYKLFALTTDRNKLYERINLRVDKMISNGLFDEFLDLCRAGLNKDCQCSKGIGYNEFFNFVNGEWTYRKTIEKIKQHSRNYAKRQLTLLRAINPIWVEAFPRENAINQILKEVKNGQD